MYSDFYTSFQIKIKSARISSASGIDEQVMNGSEDMNANQRGLSYHMEDTKFVFQVLFP
jgi:hypothetical protein